jgi:tetratricopeptide (TPR) repeat protein
MSQDPLDALCQKAKEALSSGHYQEARQIYQQALGYRSDSADIHYGIATACFLVGDVHSAVYHFKEVIRIDSTRPGAYINLGAAYDRLEQFDDALTALRRGIQLDPTRGEGYYNLGLVHKQLGQIDMAINAYREAVRLNPRLHDAHYNLANIFLDKGQINQAVVHYRSALEIRPKWEKGRQALEAALAAQAEHAAHQKALYEKAAAPTPAIPQSSLNPERLLDPDIHGKYLRELHRLVIDTDATSQELLDFIQKDIEGAIRDLSISMLTPNTPGHNLNDQIDRFDKVVEKLQTIQTELQKRILRVKLISEEITKH